MRLRFSLLRAARECAAGRALAAPPRRVRGLRRTSPRTSPQAYLEAVRLTPNLLVHAPRESLPHVGQRALGANRFGMRGAEDPPPPLDHVLHDGLRLQQVVACVEIETGRVDAAHV